jgi:hypothetical protein
MLKLYWVPPTEGASPQRLKIWKAGGGIELIDAKLIDGAWLYEVDDCPANRNWIARAAKGSGWSIHHPGQPKPEKPKRKPRVGEIAEEMPVIKRAPRARSTKRPINFTRSVG